MTERLRDDFSSGLIAATRWQPEVTGGGDTPSVVNTTIGGRTSQIAKFRCGPSTQRSELSVCENGAVLQLLRHTRVATRQKILFPSGYPINTTEWQLAGQWKDLAFSTNPNGQSTSPPIAIGARRGQLEMRSSFRGVSNFTELQFMPVTFDTWYDLVFDVWLDGKPGATGNQGAGTVSIYRVEADGSITTLLNAWQPPEGTFYTDGGQDYAVLRHGIYHNTVITTDTVMYEDDVIVATGANALAEVGVTFGSTVTNAPTVPSAPSLAQSGGVVTATWTAVVGATSYQLWRRPGGTVVWGRVGSQVTSTSTTDSPGSGTWEYGVSALNAAGESSQSNASQIVLGTSTAPSGILKNGGLPAGLADVWDLDPDSANLSKFSTRYYRGGAVPSTSSTEYKDSPPFSKVIAAKQAFVASDVVRAGGKAFKVSIPSSGGVTSRFMFRPAMANIVVTPSNVVHRWYRFVFRVDSPDPTALKAAIDAHNDSGTWFLNFDAPGTRFNNTGDNGPYGPFGGSSKYPDGKRHWRAGSNSNGTVGAYFPNSIIDFGEIIIGKIYDLLIHRAWSRTTQGKAEAWVNGSPTSVYNGPTVESVSFGSGDAQFEHRMAFYWGGGFTTPMEGTYFVAKVGSTRAQVVSDTPPSGLPTAPTGVKAVVSVTAANKPQVTVTSSPATGMIAGDGYQVYRDGTVIAGGAAGAPLATPSFLDADPSLDWGQTHEYRVGAGQPGRYGPWSAAATVILTSPGDTVAPAAPAQPTVTSVSATSIQLSWVPNTEADFARYILQRATGTGAFADLDTNVTATSYNDASVVAGTTYNYRLKAVDTAGNVSAPGQSVTVTAEAAPTTPTGLTVTTSAPRQATLTWTAVAGARGYEIYRNGSTIASGISGTSFTDTVEPGDYVYQIASGIAPNLSAKSAGVAAQVYGINVLPASVDLTAAREGATSPILYQIELTGRGTFAVTDDASWLVVTPASGTLSDTPTVITFSADPTGRLIGQYNATVSFVEGPAPTPPINVSAPTISGTQRAGNTLTGGDGTWGGSPTGFTRTWYRNSGTASAWVSVGTGATYALTPADVGFTIRFGVIAANAVGSSGEVFSDPTGAIAAALVAPTNTALPAVSGTAQSGQTLTGTMGSWTGTPTSYAYQWQRETAAGSGIYTNIAGAAGTSTGAGVTYALTGAEVGLKVRIQVTATNAAGTSGAVTSSPTTTVTSSAPSLILARYAMSFDGSNQKVVLANAGSHGSEPLTWGALVYLTAISGRTADYYILGFPSTGAPSYSFARMLTYDSTADRIGWQDNSLGLRGAAGFVGGNWFWVVAGRNSDGRIRATFCDMATGVWATEYDQINTAWTFSPTSAGSLVIGHATPVSVTGGWSGRILAGFKSFAFLTLAQMKALVSSSGSTFYIDPSVLLAAPSVEHVWRLDDPLNPIQDLKGAANETSRMGVTRYDAGSAVLPLKVN